MYLFGNSFLTKNETFDFRIQVSKIDAIIQGIDAVNYGSAQLLKLSREDKDQILWELAGITPSALPSAPCQDAQKKPSKNSVMKSQNTPATPLPNGMFQPTDKKCSSHILTTPSF